MKKFLTICFAFVLAITLTGCGSNNNSSDKKDNNNEQTEQTGQNESYDLSAFENDVKELVPEMVKSEVYYQMVGAIDGFKIYNNSDETYRVEIYKFDKNSEEYKKAEADQKLSMDSLSFDAKVKNGYALLIDDEFPKHDEIIKLFEKLD